MSTYQKDLLTCIIFKTETRRGEAKQSVYAQYITPDNIISMSIFSREPKRQGEPLIWLTWSSAQRTGSKWCSWQEVWISWSYKNRCSTWLIPLVGSNGISEMQLMCIQLSAVQWWSIFIILQRVAMIDMLLREKEQNLACNGAPQECAFRYWLFSCLWVFI
jgi:hypothetical protein